VELIAGRVSALSAPTNWKLALAMPLAEGDISSRLTPTREPLLPEEPALPLLEPLVLPLSEPVLVPAVEPEPVVPVEESEPAVPVLSLEVLLPLVADVPLEEPLSLVELPPVELEDPVSLTPVLPSEEPAEALLLPVEAPELAPWVPVVAAAPVVPPVEAPALGLPHPAKISAPKTRITSLERCISLPLEPADRPAEQASSTLGSKAP